MKTKVPMYCGCTSKHKQNALVTAEVVSDIVRILHTKSTLAYCRSSKLDLMQSFSSL